MNDDARDTMLLLQWWRRQKDCRDAIDVYEAELKLRNRRASAMAARSSEWAGKSPELQKEIIARVKAEVDEEVKA